MLEENSLNVGQLFGGMVSELRQNWAVALIVLSGLTVGNMIVDNYTSTGSFALSGIMSLVGQYMVTRSAVNRAGLLVDGAPSRFGSFWGMLILSNIGIIVGLIALVVPGLYIASRWFISAPAILAEDLGASEGMRQSWELTRASVWQILVAILVLYACGFGIGIVPLIYFAEGAVALSIQAVSNILILGASVLGWLMAVGAYRLLTASNRDLEEVFA